MVGRTRPGLPRGRWRTGDPRHRGGRASKCARGGRVDGWITSALGDLTGMYDPGYRRPSPQLAQVVKEEGCADRRGCLGPEGSATERHDQGSCLTGLSNFIRCEAALGTHKEAHESALRNGY